MPVVKSKIDFPLVLSRIFIVFGMLLIIYPLSILVVTSLKSEMDFMNNSVGLPEKLHIQNYSRVFKVADIPSATMNSIVITGISIGGQVIVGSMAAYALSKMYFRRSKLFTVLFLVPLIFSGQMVVLPLFVLFKWINLLNTRIGLIFIYLAGGLPLSILLLSRFMKTIPIQISEAAFIDGASHFRIFLLLIFPLLQPVIATNIIINGLTIWNDFFLPFIFLTSGRIQTLPLGIYLFTEEYGTQWTLIATDIIYTILPAVIVYIFLQKFIISGVASGSIKQ